MYKDVLKSIIAKAEAYGESLQPPCSVASLNNLRLESQHKLGHEIPEAYASLLSTMDGLDWNGLVIYSSEHSPIVHDPERSIEGFIQGNLDYRELEPMKDYLIFADDGDCLYTYSISRNKFQVITTVGLSELETFDTFDEVIENAMRNHA